MFNPETQSAVWFMETPNGEHLFPEIDVAKYFENRKKQKKMLNVRWLEKTLIKSLDGEK